MIGIVLTLVFGLFGAVMALLNYIDRDREKTIQAPAAESPSGHRGRGQDKK